MACDVFLIVFYKYDAEDLRKLEIKYIGAITAFCFIPAVSFLFVHTPEKGPMYAGVIVSAIFHLRRCAIDRLTHEKALVFGGSTLGAL